jgi:GxxExxY protein
MELNEISSRIIAAALKVHTAIGPGVLESVYQTCLLHELKKAGLAVQSQVVYLSFTMAYTWIQATE